MMDYPTIEARNRCDKVARRAVLPTADRYLQGLTNSSYSEPFVFASTIPKLINYPEESQDPP